MKKLSNQSGFTLVEVLVAMFIFALISVGTMTALTASLRGKTQMSERLTAVAEIEGMRALMKSDFASLKLLPVRDAYGSKMQYVMTGGIDSLVEFTRAGRTNPGGLESRSEYQRVTYVFEGGQLIRRVLAQSNPAPQTPVIERVLLDGLTSVSAEFHLVSQQEMLVNGDRLDVTINKPAQEYVLIEAGQTKDIPNIITFKAEFENGSTLVQHFEVSL